MSNDAYAAWIPGEAQAEEKAYPGCRPPRQRLLTVRRERGLPAAPRRVPDQEPIKGEIDG